MFQFPPKKRRHTINGSRLSRNAEGKLVCCLKLQHSHI